MARTYCTKCKTDFDIDIRIQESTVKKDGEYERCIVQYFRCPSCYKKYYITVMDEHLKGLNDTLKELLKHHEDMDEEDFKCRVEKLKNRISAEASMLLHLYKKQHRKDNDG